VTSEYVSQATLRDATLPSLKGRDCPGAGYETFYQGESVCKEGD